MLDAEHLSHGSMDDLEVAKKVVLWSVRTRLEGMASFDRIRQAFRRAYDPTSADVAFGAFEPWFLILANHCRRDLHLHRPQCPCLSDDEREMLDLIAHVQGGDADGARHVAASLVHERALVAFLCASLNLAQALGRLDLRLPQRNSATPPAATVH
jgi:hypothetical protein